jgi:hypothetical protein
MRIALLIVAALVAAIPAFAHSWYPLACCGNMVLHRAGRPEKKIRAAEAQAT